MWRRARRRYSARKEATAKPKPFSEYRYDPIGFIREVLGDDPWSKQCDLATLVIENRMTACAAAKGPGKTWIAARLVLWFLFCYEDSVVVTRATTEPQLKNQLWREIRAAHAESFVPLPGKAEKLHIDLAEKWFAIGVSPKDPRTMAGYHGRADPDPKKRGPVLVVCDEASGVPDAILDALHGLLTNPDSRMLWIGNPTALSGRFYEAFHPPIGTELDDWPFATLHISAYDAPEWIIDREQIESMEKLCGPEPEKNPLFASDILGQFPEQAERYLFPLVLLEACSEIVPKIGGRHMGVDIAREGTDTCVAVLVENGRVMALKQWSERGAARDLMRSATIIRNLAVGDTWAGGENPGWDVEPRNVHIDATGGYGSGVCDRLWEMNLPVDPVYFGDAPEEENYWRMVLGTQAKLPRRRDELHWRAARLMQEGHLAIPRVAQFGPLWRDLTDIICQPPGADEMFRVEKKEEYRKRTGRSPDFSDALLCALSRTNPTDVRFRKLGGKPGPRNRVFGPRRVIRPPEIRSRDIRPLTRRIAA